MKIPSNLRYTCFPIMVAILLHVAGCTPLQQKRRQPECKALFQLIDTTWTQDVAVGIYRLYRNKPDPKSPIVNDILKCQHCFTGLSHKDMEKLFGTPDTTCRGHLLRSDFCQAIFRRADYRLRTNIRAATFEGRGL
jgi:hypothetical protein